jgi:N-methylhydantoinase B
VRVQSAGGGGYGDPHERDPALIVEDLKNGYITAEGAKADYGYTSVTKN